MSHQHLEFPHSIAWNTEKSKTELNIPNFEILKKEGSERKQFHNNFRYFLNFRYKKYQIFLIYIFFTTVYQHGGKASKRRTEEKHKVCRPVADYTERKIKKIPKKYH